MKAKLSFVKETQESKFRDVVFQDAEQAEASYSEACSLFHCLTGSRFRGELPVKQFGNIVRLPSWLQLQ